MSTHTHMSHMCVSACVSLSCESLSLSLFLFLSLSLSLSLSLFQSLSLSVSSLPLSCAHAQTSAAAHSSGAFETEGAAQQLQQQSAAFGLLAARRADFHPNVTNTHTRDTPKPKA